MATGGFNRHPKRRAEMLHAPTAEHSPAAPGHTGEMHDLALSAGARYGEGALDSAFWAPVSVRRRADGSTAVFPHLVLDRGKPGMVAVNKAGRRFVNESTSYHLFVRAMYKAHETVPSIPAFLITDSEGLRRYGLGMVRPGGKGLAPFLADGYLTRSAEPGRARGQARHRRRRPGGNGRAHERVRADRHRPGIRPRHHRLPPRQRRRLARPAEPQSRSDRRARPSTR